MMIISPLQRYGKIFRNRLFRLGFYVFLGKNKALSSIYPPQKCIYPAYGDAEPTVGADWFAAKTQNEFAVGIAREWKSDVEEINVLVATGMSILDGVPQCQFVWMQHRI